jgi:hypothetical protein
MAIVLVGIGEMSPATASTHHEPPDRLSGRWGNVTTSLNGFQYENWYDIPVLYFTRLPDL